MSEKKDIKLLRKRAEKFRAFLFSKDALSFLFFLFLSAVIWFVHAGNKEQEKTISIPVSYVDAPKNIAVTSPLPKEIKINIKDQGFILLFYPKKAQLPLSINLSSLDPNKKQASFPSEYLLTLLHSRLKPTTSITNFNTDTIRIDYKILSSKVLPVKLNANLELAQQYVLSEETKIVPGEITVYGEKEDLKNLKFVQTKKTEINTIKKDSTYSLELDTIQSINFSTNKVDVSIFVEMFTERKLILPIQLKNNTSNYIFKAFPPELTVTYNIAESIYNTKEDLVEIVVDYDEIKNYKQDKYRPKAIAKSKKIFNIKIVPEEIEFILKERK